MPDALLLFAVYGMAFGLQNNKVVDLDGLRRVVPPIDRLLSCTFCTGFHCGWMVWLLWWLALDPKVVLWAPPVSMFLWAMASAAFSYAVDTLVQWHESDVQDDEPPA